MQTLKTLKALKTSSWDSNPLQQLITFNKLNFGNGKNLLQKILGSKITKFLISKGENLQNAQK